MPSAARAFWWFYGNVIMWQASDAQYVIGHPGIFLKSAAEAGNQGRFHKHGRPGTIAPTKTILLPIDRVVLNIRTI